MNIGKDGIVKTQQDFATGDIRIRLVQPGFSRNTRCVAKWNAKKMDWEWVEYKEGSPAPDSLRLPFPIAQSLLAALQDAGVPSPDSNHMCGKLEAMTDHLKDMRRLVFKGKK